MTRASDHRGRVGSNLWYIDLGKDIIPDTEDHKVFLDRMECGHCNWDEFNSGPSKTIKRPLPDYLISKKILVYDDKVYVGRDFDDIDNLPEWWFKDANAYDQVESQGEILETIDDLRSQFYDYNNDVEFDMYPEYLKIKRKLIENRNKQNI